MTAETEVFIHSIVAEVEDIQPVLQDHLEDNDGELLPHVLFGELTRWMTVDGSARPRAIDRLLELLDVAYADGPADVRELIFVSFLENLPTGAELRTRLGPHLAHALREFS